MKLFTLSHEKQPEVSQPTKKRKLDVINVDELDMPDSFSKAPVPWLTCANIELTIVDRCIITSGNLLSDKHIDFAQALLRKHHKELTGLNSTLLLANHRNLASSAPSLQILHTRGNHWIVATTSGYPIGSPKVFDSLHASIDLPMQKLLSLLYGSAAKVEYGPKQLGVKDCGVYTIATASSSMVSRKLESLMLSQLLQKLKTNIAMSSHAHTLSYPLHAHNVILFSWIICYPRITCLSHFNGHRNNQFYSSHYYV